MSDPLATDPEPGGKFNFLQMAPMLIFDVALPIIIFNVLSSRGVPVLWALILGGLSPGLNNLRVWIKSRRLEPLGIIVITLLALGAAGSLLSGSVFFALIKESFLTGVFGLICLGSLLTARPLLFVILRQFVAGEDSARIAWWNGLYEFPAFRGAIRFVTTVWGIVYLLEAFARVGFALTLKPAEVVEISPIMMFVVLIALIMWTRRYMLAFRQGRIRDQQAARAG